MASLLNEDILLEDFRILKSLGLGTFGEVKLACHLPTHTQVAVKILEKENNALDKISSEVNILKVLEHKNIVKFFHVFDTLTTTYVVMEYVAGKDLELFLRDIDYLEEEKARLIFKQVVSGVHYLHQRHIAHRDIKLENIIIDRAGKVKLCDFGLAIQLTEGQMLEEICGSFLYLAPEILARKPYDGLAVDMWSLGVVLYVLVTGNFPYVETTLDGMHRITTSTKYPIPSHLSKPCRNIIDGLLMVPTQHRITICELRKRSWLGHVEDHVAPETKRILPHVVELMCKIGYTREEIVSSLTHRQPNDKVTAPLNILKYKLSCGDCNQPSEKTWVNINPLDVPQPSLPLKRTSSEPAFSTIMEAEKRKFQKEGLEGRGKGCQSYTMFKQYSCLEVMPSSDATFPERSLLMSNFINSAPAHIASHVKSVDSLSGDLSSCESSLDGIAARFLNMDFSSEEPSMQISIPNKQPQVVPTTSESRSLRVRK
ncbi:sperm motility kinase W, partial [Sigmodon hispidus]